MQLKDQVVSLDLSKRLKELGYKQEGLWWWQVCKPSTKEWQVSTIKTGIVAPTCAELGITLPEYYKTIRKDGMWGCYDDNGDGYVETISKTEVNSRASMLIYLLENKLMEL